MSSKKDAVPGHVSRLSQLNSRLLSDEKEPTDSVANSHSGQFPSPPMLAVPLFSFATSLLQVNVNDFHKSIFSLL